MSFWIPYHIHGDDGGGGTIDFDNVAVGGSEQEAADNAAVYNSALDPSYSYTFTYQPPSKVYILLDKGLIIRLLNYAPSVWWAISVISDAGPFKTQLPIPDSTKPGGFITPRHTWHGNEGLKTPPGGGGAAPGKGPSGDVLKVLIEIYNYFVTSGFSAQANAMLTIIRLFMAGKINGDQAFARAQAIIDSLL